MPLPLTVSCFSKIQIGFAFLVLAHLGSPGKRAIKRVCVCVCGRSNKYPMGFEHVCMPSLDWLVGAFWREIVGLKAPVGNKSVTKILINDTIIFVNFKPLQLPSSVCKTATVYFIKQHSETVMV